MEAFETSFLEKRTTRVLVGAIGVGIIIAGVIFVLGSQKRGADVLLVEDSQRIQDCGSSWDCLVSAAVEGCKNTEALTTTKKSEKVAHQIKRSDEISCLYHHELKEVQGVEVVSGTVSQTSQSGTCQLEFRKLAGLIAEWQEETVMPSDFSGEQCAGTYLFGYNYNPETGTYIESGFSEESQSSGGNGSESDPSSDGDSGNDDSEDGAGSPPPPPPPQPPPQPQPQPQPPPPPGGPQCTLSGPSSVSLPPGASSSLSINGYQGSSSQVVWDVFNQSILSVNPKIGSVVSIQAHTIGTTQIDVIDTAIGTSCRVIVSITVQGF